MQACCTEAGAFSCSQATVLAKLQEKHPIRVVDGLTQDELDSLKNFRSEVRNQISASPELVRSIILNSHSKSQHGVDKLRYDHLKTLVGRRPDNTPEETEFVQLLCTLINAMLQSKVPKEVLPALRDTEIIALPKPGSVANDVRPIGMAGVLRKIAAKVGFQIAESEFNARHFKDIQLSHVRSGIVEHIDHQLQSLVETDPTKDIYTIDAMNAFNRIHRMKALLEIKKHFPQLIPFLRDMYFDESKGWFFGVEEGIQSINSSEGFQQGDTLATWCFNMALMPLLNGLKAMVAREFPSERALVKFYVDDGNIAAPHAVMVRIIEYLTIEGPKYGYIINKDKGCYLMGKAGIETMKARRAGLVSMGLKKDIIKP
jgi:hypothetical protein